MTLFFLRGRCLSNKMSSKSPRSYVKFCSVCIRFHRHDLARLRSKVIVTSTGRWTWQTSVRRWFLSLQGETSSFFMNYPAALLDMFHGCRRHITLHADMTEIKQGSISRQVACMALYNFISLDRSNNFKFHIHGSRLLWRRE